MNARAGQIRRHHWCNHHADGLGDVGRVYAEMAWTVARRHSHRARTFCILFSHRHLHLSQHPLELAAIDLPSLEESASLKTMAKDSPRRNIFASWPDQVR